MTALKRTFLVSLLTLSAWADTIQLQSQWVVTPQYRRVFEIPQQRTKPIVVGDIIYFADIKGKVSAYHRTGGYLLWEKQLEGGVEGALAYGRSKILVGDLQGNLYALNARDGSENWRFKIQAEWLSPPFIYRDKVLAATSNDEVYALSESRGKEVWHFSHRGDEKMTVRGTSGPTVYGDVVYQGLSDGNLVALSLNEGRLEWMKRLRTKPRFYDVDATPVADDQGVVGATFDGNLYSLDAKTGNTQWIFAAGAYGTPLLEDGKVYFAGLDGFLYALDRKSKAVLWKTPFGAGVGSAPTKVGDQLAFTISSDSLVLVDKNTGKFLTTENLGSGTLAGPVGSPDGWLYCLTNYSNMIAYQVLVSNGKREPAAVESPSAVTRELGKPTPTPS